MAVLGELPDQFVDYMVMKENERDKIYQPQEPQLQGPDPFNEPAINTARNGPDETFVPPGGPVPEEFKSSPADQEAAMI